MIDARRPVADICGAIAALQRIVDDPEANPGEKVLFAAWVEALAWSLGIGTRMDKVLATASPAKARKEPK